MNEFKFSQSLLLKFFFVLLILCVFSLNFLQNVHRPIEEVDEAAWIYSTYFYHLAFERKDVNSPDWKNRDALDHPPLYKFLLGAMLAGKNLHTTSYGPKKWWHENDLNISRSHEFVNQLRHDIPMRALFLGRLLSAILMFLSACLVFWLGRRIFSFPVGILSAIFFTIHPLVQKLSCRIVADNLFVLLLLVCVSLLILFLDNICQLQRSWIVGSFLGICCALLFLTKISGIAVFGIMGIALLRKKQWISVICSIFSFLAVTYALNPSFYHQPIVFVIDMFRYRYERVNLQMNVFYWSALPHHLLSLSYFLRKIFFEWDGFFNLTFFPPMLVLFSCGLLRLPHYLKMNVEMVCAVLLFTGFWTACVVFSYKINWERYLLSIIPFVSIIVALGFEQIFVFFHTRLKKALFLLTPAVLFCAAVFSFQHFYTIDHFKTIHPDWHLRAKAEHLKLMLGFDADHLEFMDRLATLYFLLGERERAKEVWQDLYLKASEHWPQKVQNEGVDEVK